MIPCGPADDLIPGGRETDRPLVTPRSPLVDEAAGAAAGHSGSHT
jgi:hypothetical protein